MSKISCSLSIDMLAPYIEDILVDNPVIGGENGVPLAEVYRQTLMYLEDVIDNFRTSIKNISLGIPTDNTDLIKNLIPASIDMQHAIKKAKNEAYELNVPTSLKVFRKSMSSAIDSLVQDWDAAVENTGTSGTSIKSTNLEQSEMPDGDAPVGNIDVAVPYRTPVKRWADKILGKRIHSSIDSIIQDSLGYELIEKAPQLIYMFKDVIGHSIADTRVSSSGIRFTTNKRSIKNEIKSKLKEAVTVYYENNAIGIGTSLSKGNTSKLDNNILILTREQLPVDVEEVEKGDAYTIYKSKHNNIVDKNGKARLLLVGDPIEAGVTGIISVGDTNLPLTRSSVIETNNELTTNAYLALVLLNNFDSMVTNIFPVLSENENNGGEIRTQSLDITDAISGNQAKDITRANIVTTVKLANTSKDTLSKTVSKLKATIRDRGTTSVSQTLKNSGVLDTLVGDKPVLRIRMADNTFEDVIVLKINNRRYPLVLNREDPKHKFWALVTNVDPKTGIQFDTDKTNPAFKEEKGLLSLMNSLLKVDRIAEARDLSDMKVHEVTIDSVFSNINDITASLLDSKKGLKIYETAENSSNVFLSEEEVEAMCTVFLKLPQDLYEASAYLSDIVDESFGATGDILRGLYNKYFNTKEYYITRKNPVTGVKETQKHNSFYRIAKTNSGKEGRQAMEQLVALKSMLNTIAPNEFISMFNGSAVLSNTLSGNTLKTNLEDIDFKGTTRVGQYYFTDDISLKKFKILPTTTPGVIQIIHRPGIRKKSFTVKTNGGSFGGGSFTLFPFTIEDDSNLSLNDFKAILKDLKLPTKFATKEFLSLTGATGKDQKDLKDFIATMVSLKLANGNRKSKSYLKMVGNKAANAELLSKNLIKRKVINKTTYPISEHLPKDYKELLKTVLDKFEGLTVRKFVEDNDFNKRMTTATVNKGLKLLQVIKKAVSFGKKNLYVDSYFSTGKLTFEGVYSKNGITEGVDGKTNQKLTTQEQFRFLVESSFLDTAQQKNFAKAAFQPSTKADRSTIGTFLVGKTGSDSFLPITIDGKFDKTPLIKALLNSQETFYKSMDKKILDEWIGEGTKYGKGFLQRIYDREVSLTNVYGDQVTISKGTLEDVKTVRDLANLLEELQLDFTQVTRLSGIISNLGFDQFSVNENLKQQRYDDEYINLLGEDKYLENEPLTGEDIKVYEALRTKYLLDTKGKKVAGIRSSTIRMSEIMRNPKTAEEFINKNKLYFDKSINKLFDNNFVPSLKSINTIENRFGKMSEKDAKSILLDSFYYNDILISNELSRFETGPIEQFKLKLQRGPIETELIKNNIIPPLTSFLDAVGGNTNKEKLKNITKILSPYSYTDLAGDTRLGVAKRIIEDPLLKLEDKISLLEFDDLSSQLSPSYVEQVKRNQGVGTSLQMFTTASTNRGGAFVGKSSKNVTISDPTEKVFLLGNSGKVSVDTHDATMIMLPGGMIKYNNSLGNRMSNFASKGGAFKDANVSSTEDGYYLYQKKASQPLFGAEFLINATPEHLNLYNKLVTTIKWNNTELYVENINNESITDEASIINYDKLQRYGESLGILTTPDGENVHAESLLFKLENEELSPEDINNMGLVTTKVLKSFNTIKDLLDHFGGVDGDYNRLITNTTERSDYTFGYSWHQAIDVISNYRGEQANYPLRDGYIEKIGVSSQEKTGSRSVNPASALSDNSELMYEEVPNSESGIILQPDHNPDTTSSMNTKKDAEHDSDIKVITQILSASVGEGEGFENVKEILTTVSTIVDMEMNEFEAEIAEFSARYKTNFPDASKEEIKQAGYLSIAYDLTKTSLQTRKDPGITGSMLFDNDPNEINFDHKAILPVLRTAVNAELNKRAVNLRFKGNQTVVTASNGQIKSYTFGTSKGLFRSTINKLADKRLSNNLTLPEGWELNPVNKFDNLVDTDYVYEESTGERTTFGKFRQMSDTQGKTFRSIFSSKSNGLNQGESLKWFNYRTADGSQNLNNTLEFKRYMTASGFFGMVQISGSDKALLAFPEYTPKFAKLALKVSNEKEFIVELAKDLHDVLQTPGKWVTDEAEFYVPPMHQAAFLIDDFDTLHDIIGEGPQPDTKGLLSLELINKKEFEILERKFSSSEGQAILFRLKTSGNEQAKTYVIAKEAQTAALFEYFGGSSTTDGKVKKELKAFKNLLIKKSLKKIKQSEDKRLSAILGKHPLLGLLDGEISSKTALKRISNIISANPKMSSIQLDLLLELQSKLKNTTVAETNAIIETTINNQYINTWIQTLVDNFPYTLTFISARIPASGKQSYVAAKVKNFIFSTRNASYGPLELIGISGADYDIDKQNNLTWDVDIYGKVYDWLDYEDETGNLLPTKAIKIKIDEDVTNYKDKVSEFVNPETLDEIVAAYRKSKIDNISRRLQNRVVRGLITNITDPKNAIEAATAVALSKLKGIKKHLAEYNYGQMEDDIIFKRAFKDAPEVKALLSAIESTGDLSKDLKILKKSLNEDQLKSYANSAISLLMEPRKHALPLSSLTKMVYERVNLDGKTGIGIFASALKGYFGSYYAWVGNAGITEYRRIVDEMRDSGELTKFSSLGEANDEIVTNKMSLAGKKELERLQFSTPYVTKTAKGKISKDSVLSDKDIETLGEDFNATAIQVVAKNSDGTFKIDNITTLANTGKWGIKGYIATANAKTAAKEVSNATTPEEEKEIIGKFISSTNMFRNFNVESQAWADLSELLNAATDNAKELILGYIGATSNTDATIAAMVVMGVDLNNALTLLNDPIVKKVIKKLESKDNLFGYKPEFSLTLAKELVNSVKNYKFDSEKFKEINSALSPEEMAKQIVLGKLYNPAKQLSVFAKVGEELTSLSSGFFSINQGLPNSEYDVFNFMRKANKALQTGTFEDFVENETKREAMIDEFQKTGLNVPYIVASNPHYFGQFKALNLTNKIVNSVSFISNLVRSDLLKHKGKRIEKRDYSAHTNAIYGLIVDAFYNDQNNSNVKLTIGDKNFDLSKVSQKGDIGGRLEFIKYIPDVVTDSQNEDELSSNAFISSLSINTKAQDRETGDQMVYVFGPATEVMTPEDISIKRANANKLRKSNPELFNALFNYSLIVDRGGLSKGSLAQFFSANDFKDYNEFVKRGDIETTLAQIFDGISVESRQLLTPSIINTVSADAAYKSAKNRISDEEPPEYDNAEDSSRADRRNKLAYRHQLSWLNTARANKIKNFAAGKRDTPAENVLRIKETGIIVAWNEMLKTFLPITKAIPDVSIPTSVNGIKAIPKMTRDVNNETDSVFDITNFGFDYGWGINVTSDFKGSKQGRLLRKTVDAKKNDYFDVLVDGQIKRMHIGNIQRYNPGIVFNKYGMIDLSGVGQVTDGRTMYYNVATKKILFHAQDNYIPVDINSNLEYVFDATDMTVFNQSFADYVIKKIGKKVDKNYALENFNKSPVVKNFRKAIATSTARIETKTKTLMTDADIEASENPRVIAILREFDNLSQIHKIDLMRNGQDVWENFISSITGVSNVKWNVGESEFNKTKIPNKITQLELSYITDPTLAATISIGQTLAIVKPLKINEALYYNKVLKALGEDKTAYVKFDGTVINGERFLPEYIINPNVQESKDYVIPVEMNMEANKLIGAKSLKRIAKVFNDKFTNTRTEVLNSEEIRSEYGNRYANLRGFVINGRIILNQDKASISTPIHELGHVYLAYLKDVDMKLYDYIISESLNSNITQSIKDAYPELNITDVGEEVFVEMLGLEFGKNLLSVSTSNKSWNNIKHKLSTNKSFGKITDFFRTVMEWFTGKKISKNIDFTLNDSLSSIMSKLGNSIVYGRGSIFNDFVSGEQTAMRLADPNGTLTSEELVKLLTDKGYIRKICP